MNFSLAGLVCRVAAATRDVPYSNITILSSHPVTNLLMVTRYGATSQARAAHGTAVSIRRNGFERIHGMWCNIATSRSHRARSKEAEIRGGVRLSSGGLIYAMNDAYTIYYMYTYTHIFAHSCTYTHARL